MQILRTADEHFADLPEFPYAAEYCECLTKTAEHLQVAWVEDGPAHADPVLMLRGGGEGAVGRGRGGGESGGAGGRRRRGARAPLR